MIPYKLCAQCGTVEHLTTKHFIVHFVTVADLEAERKGHARQAVKPHLKRM